jgi:hypothetical protein
MISENFPPHPHMYNTMPPIFPEQRNSNGIINFPPPSEEVKAITPPQLYIIKTRILLATFLLIPLLFFSSRLLTHCILRRNVSKYPIIQNDNSPFQAKTENLDTALFRKISEAKILLGNAMIVRKLHHCGLLYSQDGGKLETHHECSTLHGYEKCNL